MCGISIIAKEVRAPIDERRIISMNRALAHRGPDASEVLQRPGAALGHTRLSIVDIQAGRQPMQTQDGRFAIVFNGEIYNYQTLRAKLNARHIPLRTQSDTEVILELYRLRGADCLDLLRGMFAFAVHDRDSGEIFMARDRLGLKPLFFHATGSTLVAASEIKALFASGLVEPALCEASVANYFTYQFSVSPYTPFRGVSELPPGCCLRFNGRSRPTISRYWDLDFPRDGDYESRDEGYWLRRFSDAAHDAVDSHTTGEVPIGAYLSGGIDSCATTRLLTQHYPAPVKTFSIGFADPGYDESSEFRAVAAHLGVENHELRLENRAQGYLDELVAALYHLEQPQRMSVDIPHLMLSEYVRSQHHKVVYTGDGADEILAGYDCFRQDSMRMQSNGGMRRLLRPWRYLRQYTRYFAADHMRMLLALHTTRRQRKTIERFGCYPAWHDFWHITARARAQVLPPEALAAGEAQLDELIEEMRPQLRGRHPLNQSLYFETKTRLPGWILWKSDRLSMAHGVETRLPFMDHPLVELAARMPPELKLNGLEEKYILKRWMVPQLPPRADGYKKRGFYTPIRDWFFTPERYKVLEPYLSPEALAQCGLFPPDIAQRLYRQLRALGRPTSFNGTYRAMQTEWTLFTILSVQILHAMFVNKQAPCFTKIGSAPHPAAAR